MSDIIFIKGEPPTSLYNQRPGDLPGILTKLRARPKEWAMIRVVGIKSAQSAIAWKRRAGPDFEFHTTITGAPKGKRHIYARFIGNGKTP